MARYNLNTSWTKIASSGTTVEIQNLSSVGILIVTSTTAPVSNVDGELLFGPVPFRQFNLTQDLYAKSTTPTGAIVEVLTGLGSLGGGGGTSSGGPTTIADGGDATQGAQADSTATSDSGTFSIVSLIKRGLASLTGIKTTLGSPLQSNGNVNVLNFPIVQPISGTVNVGNFPLTQNVSGSVSITNYPPTQNVAGTVSISNFPSTQNISGTVSVSNFPAIQNVSGTVSISNFPTSQNVVVTSTTLATGASTAANQTTEIGILNYIANNSPTFGQKVKANSAPVTIASDQVVAVATPTPNNVVVGQVKIITTGTAVQLPSVALQNGIGLKARLTNANNGFVGASTVSTTYDGTGSGFPLEPGATVSFNIPNASALWINGTSGDVFSYQGN